VIPRRTGAHRAPLQLGQGYRRSLRRNDASFLQDPPPDLAEDLPEADFDPLSAAVAGVALTIRFRYSLSLTAWLKAVSELCTKNPGRSFFEAARYRACASRTAPADWDRGCRGAL